MDMSLEVVTADFDQWVDGFLYEYPGQRRKALRRVMLGLLSRIVQRNPVDSGRSRAGWFPYMDHAREEGLTEQSVSDIVRKQQVQRFRGTSEAEMLGRSEGSFREDLTGLDTFVEVVNGVPYIVELEYGWSDQAPAGMVRVSMREMLAGEIDDEFEAAIVAADQKAGRSRRVR